MMIRQHNENIWIWICSKCMCPLTFYYCLSKIKHPMFRNSVSNALVSQGRLFGTLLHGRGKCQGRSCVGSGLEVWPQFYLSRTLLARGIPGYNTIANFFAHSSRFDAYLYALGYFLSTIAHHRTHFDQLDGRTRHGCIRRHVCRWTRPSICSSIGTR